MKFNVILVIYHRILLLAHIIIVQSSIFPNVCLPFSLYVFIKPCLQMCQSNINSNSPRWWMLVIYIGQVHSLSFIFITKAYLYRKQCGDFFLQKRRKRPAGGRLQGPKLLLALRGMGVVFGNWRNQHVQKSDGTDRRQPGQQEEWLESEGKDTAGVGTSLSRDS